MSLHLFGSVITAEGVAANNRGETEGNITTLQKLLWKGNVHTTVSAEAIRWAVRYYWQLTIGENEVNRVWDDKKSDHKWNDPTWSGWLTDNGIKYIDDDLLGYMEAKAAQEDGEGSDENDNEKKKKKKKGTVIVRRGVFEITRAISLLPYAGDITFNAKSGEKGRTSLYGTEVHATRYQYGFALTPERLEKKERTIQAIDAILNLGEVAGNHSRFLYDFSPDSIILRVTDDPAPRLLFCFEQDEKGVITAGLLVKRIKAADIKPEELYIGGPISENEELRSIPNIKVYPGVKAAAADFIKEAKSRLNL